MASKLFVFFLVSALLLVMDSSFAQMPGFVSLDCGGKEGFRDELGLEWSPDNLNVCLSNATTGQPFISTLELRQFNGSMYYTEFEAQFYLSISARINFGADSEAPIRYPDDPFDRIWESDSLKKANYLVDVATGTKKVSTKLPIDVNRDDRPPVKVMQTAVVGTNGSLTYRLNLDGFPGPGWAFTYFAEIEDLAPDESRKFRLVLPGNPEISKAIVNIEENAQGKYRLYEPGFTNLSLPFVLSFRFGKTSDSSRGPLLNAMEINKYLEKNVGSIDGKCNAHFLSACIILLLDLRSRFSGDIIANVVSGYLSADWAQEGGDPCLPVPWSWVQCNSDPQPRVVSIFLSKKNLTGNIPSDLIMLSGLVELWLDGNSLTGPIPDFSGCVDLRIIHLENNQLTGPLPSSLLNLPNLKELHVQNNLLSGTVPRGLLNRNLVLEASYSGNINLHKGSASGSRVNIVVGSSVGAAGLLIATIVSFIFIRKVKKRHPERDQPRHTLPVQMLVSSKSNAPAEAAHCFTFSEIEDATKKFEKKIGSGGFGVVYYGKMKDGKEIAVKALTSPLTRGQSINWLKRLEIAEDAAKVTMLSAFITQAKLHIESGDIQGIIDPSLGNEFDIQSMWKIAEKALMCVQPHGYMRPSISEVLKEIQDAISMEREAAMVRDSNSDNTSRNSAHSSLMLGSLDMGGNDNFLSLDDTIAQPSAR
ncbi:hypothetical protein FEM48_Zijuj12G0153100 [Ziziphus jujuba var. spinosa]|uniref:Malectin-like domain-containing protein n=1 Tax=Ziziphus jujuba var. spinosa TaxID=714518 RepID=A0A978UE37_ZIZJJ|nr:hypothetical protein FEM48_Zijuj12G0153100 [Ziziphus jujuba var. spinosa]